MPLWRLFLANQRLSATAAILLELRLKPRVHGCPGAACLEQHPIRLPGWQQGQYGLHQLQGPLPWMIFWHWSSGLGVKSSRGVDVVDGVQDAADLLYHLLWKCGQDQVKAQPGVSHPAAIEGGLRSEYPWSRRALVSPWLAPRAAGRLPESTTMAGVGCGDDAAAAGSSGHRIRYFPWRCALLPGLLHHHTVPVVMVLLQCCMFFLCCHQCEGCKYSRLIYFLNITWHIFYKTSLRIFCTMLHGLINKYYGDFRAVTIP